MKAMDRAIQASTGGEGNWIILKVAKAKDRE
jgi:hypothetical protein